MTSSRSLLLLLLLVGPAAAAASSCAPPPLPPVRAVYARTLQLPFVGEQTIRLHVLSRSRARLQLTGAFDVDDRRVAYWVDEESKLRFELGEPTLRLLARTRTTLLHASYDAEADVAIVVVRPGALPRLRLRLERERRRGDDDEWLSSWRSSVDGE
jgi:hypothetical protein